MVTLRKGNHTHGHLNPETSRKQKSKITRVILKQKTLSNYQIIMDIFSQFIADSGWHFKTCYRLHETQQSRLHPIQTMERHFPLRTLKSSTHRNRLWKQN